MVTVFRSADADAADQAEDVCDLLVESGMTAIVADDSEPGIEEGSFEVRVPAEQAAEAEAILTAAAEAPEDMEYSGEDMDLVSIFETGTEISEMEALSLKTLLESNNIPTVIEGATTLPNLGFDVRVPIRYLDDARRVVEEAAATGEQMPPA